MDPNKPAVLSGKNAEAFEKYQNTPATPEEIAHMKKCRKIYREQCEQDKKRKK